MFIQLFHSRCNQMTKYNKKLTMAQANDKLNHKNKSNKYSSFGRFCLYTQYNKNKLTMKKTVLHSNYTIYNNYIY